MPFSPRARRLPSRPFTDLDASWRVLLDELLISLTRFTRTISAAFSLLCALLLVAHVSHLQQATTTHPVLAPVTRLAAVPPEPVTREAPTTDAFDDFFPAIRPLRAPIPASSPTRKRYAQLATLYLAPFASTGKIQRSSYLAPLDRDPPLCAACFLLQVKAGALYVHDPHAVRAVSPEFRELRMREAISWVRSAVERGVIDDTELVISTSDGVPTTTHNHSYRMPAPDAVPRPLFSVVRCNVSDNIPFPMVLADAMRRGLGGKFWTQREGLLREWDGAMAKVGRVDGREIPWSEKIEQALFRGSVRVSSFLPDTRLFDQFCASVGRTGLWHKAAVHARALKRFDLLNGDRSRIWPLPASWFAVRTEPLLNVKVSGVCGSRIYVSDGMPMDAQNRFKYLIHAEGNSFWADRLLIHLFGSSAVIKQSTPCGMFFEPLLEPFTHYIPVDYGFNHLARQTLWASQNDEKVRCIVRNARKFAGEYLSTAAIQMYVDELLVQYSSLLEDRDIRIERGAVQLYP